MKRSIAFIILLLSFRSYSQSPRLVIPVGHNHDVLTGQYSPDGKKVLTSSVDNSAIIWEANSGRLLATLKHDQILSSASYNKDGKKIVTTSLDSTTKIWEASTGRLLINVKGDGPIGGASFDAAGSRIVLMYYSRAEIRDAATGNLLASMIGHSSTLTSAKFSPDGSRLITSSTDSSARLWEVNSGKLLLNLGPHNGYVYAADFSPDGKKIVTVSDDRVVRIWDAISGQLLFRLAGHTASVISMAFSPDGKQIVTGSTDGMVIIWDLFKGSLLKGLSGHKSAVTFLTFSPDGKKIASASKDATAIIWDVITGKLLATLAGNYSFVNSSVFSPDSKNVLTTTYGLARIWEASTGKLLHDLKGHGVMYYSVKLSSDGTRVMTRSQFDPPGIWDATKGQLLFRLKGHQGLVHEAGFSRDGKLIFTTSSDSTARIWDAKNGELKHILKGSKEEVLSAEFSPDSKRIATVSRDSSVALWDAVTSALLFQLKGFDHIAFNPDGHSAAFSSPNLNIQVFDLTNGNLISEFATSLNGQGQLKFSPDGSKLITLSNFYDTIPRVWEVATGKLLYELKGHINSFFNAGINTMAFSFDGTKLVTASRDSTAKIWDLYSGRLLADLDSKTGTVTTASFAPDGKTVLTAYSDGHIKIWDTRKGTLQKDLKAHEFDVYGAEFSRDGKRIYTASWDNTCKIFDATTGKLIYTYLVVNDHDYFGHLPSGYYRGSPGASKLIHYVTPDLKAISFEQLDVKFNRPDKILEALGDPDTTLIKGYKKAWEKRIKKLGVDTMAFRDGYSVPVAEFINRETIDFEQRKGSLTLNISGKDSLFTIDRFNIWVNEVPVFGQRGMSIRSRHTNIWDTTISISLSQGQNIIETSIFNSNGTESYRIPLVLNYTPLLKEKVVTHFIGIGLDHYARKQYDLQYSCKDIRDLARNLKKKYGNSIVIDTLFNESVSVSNIRSLKQRLSRTNINDKVILAYSGHGLLSREFDYYLSTYNISFEKPEEYGLPYEALEDLLDSIPARNKLMLIDACHSGEVDKEELVRIRKSSGPAGLTKGAEPVAYTEGDPHLGLVNSFELMQNIFVNVGRGTGATIISAAAGTQFALERDDLKNGVFTYCILEAMKNNKTLKVSELKNIVGQRVVELTNGMQKPTSRNENIAVDWEVW